eukprot:CAMPEP_0177744988 /NCGR_PEP_ID=MMETSP0484_2-20121128/30060_1 /TAXON_ID=354590 /ORGANISM="Rhodomonas lens, Strain RHODO" /LENGTH=50 /DNA_ID=CAMNT_0019259569 /DNA_START=131 /DNA_END=283 /DNA_ORIENTATION=+
MGEEGAERLAAAVAKCEALTPLCERETSIGDEGLGRLAQGLAACTALSVI